MTQYKTETGSLGEKESKRKRRKARSKRAAEKPCQTCAIATWSLRGSSPTASSSSSPPFRHHTAFETCQSFVHSAPDPWSHIARSLAPSGRWLDIELRWVESQESPSVDQRPNPFEAHRPEQTLDGSSIGNLQGYHICDGRRSHKPHVQCGISR